MTSYRNPRRLEDIEIKILDDYLDCLSRNEYIAFAEEYDRTCPNWPGKNWDRRLDEIAVLYADFAGRFRGDCGRCAPKPSGIIETRLIIIVPNVIEAHDQICHWLYNNPRIRPEPNNWGRWRGPLRFQDHPRGPFFATVPR